MPAAGRNPLVERDAELSALAAAGEDAVRGQGRLVVVEGPAGIGKTQLLRSLRDHAGSELDARVLAARGTELEGHIAFGLVRQLLDPVVFALTEEERKELFTGAARLARTVLGDVELDETAPGADRYSKINGLFWLVSTLAREKPVVLVVDDAQWADEPSLEFLSFLVRRVEGLPLLLVAATRPARDAPGHLSATLVTEPGATVLRPAPLSPDSVETLVRGAVGAEADQDFTRACLEATGGNPFLLSELLREVVARRLAPTAEAARRVGSLAPGGVSAVVELRLAQMPEGARALAEAVAVLVDHVAPGSAARVAGLDPQAAGQAETALARAGMLEERRGLCFTHPVLRASVLQGIPPTRRASLHGAAVELLRERGAAPEELATHLLHIEPAGDPQTVSSLRTAAARAEVLGAPATAADYLTRALAEPPARDQRCAVLTELGVAERAGLEEATDHLRRAVEEAGDGAARARAALELARALKFGGDAVDAVDVLGALEPDLGGLEPELRELVELEQIGLAYISEGARAQLAPSVRALRDPGREPRTRLEAFVLAGLAFDAAANGARPAAEAAELAERAVAGDLLPVDAVDGGYGMLIAGVATMWADRLDDASRIHARMLDEARRRGSVIVRAAAASMHSLVNWRRGRISEADADCSLALDLAENAHGAGALVTAARAVKALVALTRGTEHDVLSRLECGRVSVAWGSGNPTTVPWRSDAALALARAGERAEAKRLAAEELELAEAFGAKRAAWRSGHSRSSPKTRARSPRWSRPSPPSPTLPRSSTSRSRRPTSRRAASRGTALGGPGERDTGAGARHELWRDRPGTPRPRGGAGRRRPAATARPPRR